MLRLLSPLFAHNAGQQVYRLLLPHVVSCCAAVYTTWGSSYISYVCSSMTQRGAAVAYIPAAYNAGQQVYMLLLPRVVS